MKVLLADKNAPQKCPVGKAHKCAHVDSIFLCDLFGWFLLNNISQLIGNEHEPHVLPFWKILPIQAFVKEICHKLGKQ